MFSVIKTKLFYYYNNIILIKTNWYFVVKKWFVTKKKNTVPINVYLVKLNFGWKFILFTATYQQFYSTD